MSSQMDGEDSHVPSPADYESRRIRIRRLFSCRSRKGELENMTSSESLPPTEAPPPLYFILSEVGSEEMNSPSPSMENRKDDIATKNRPRCLRIPGFKNCAKDDESHNDEQTASLDKENTTMEEGDSRELSDDASSFEISCNSAFSPVMSNKYAYPAQVRQGQHLFAEQRLSMSGLQNSDGMFSVGEEDVTSFTDSSFTDSSYFKGAQLILRAFSEDSEGSDSILGVTFPHPVTAGGSRMDKGDRACRLGIASSHPFWKKRERNNVWGQIDPDPTDDPGPLPPSPIVVETSLNDEVDWDENDDEGWDLHDDIFQDTNDDDGFDGPHRRPANQTGSDTPPCRSIHALHEPEDERKPEQAQKPPSSLPDRLTKNVLEPMCQFAREISSCGRVNDAGFFDDAPFDEIALDRERKTTFGRRVMTFTQPPWDSIAAENAWGEEKSDASVEWVESATKHGSVRSQQFPRRNDTHGRMFLI